MIPLVPMGWLLPQSVLESGWFALLATFVAINSVMYGALSIARTLPKIHVRDYLPRNYVRSQSRSIYPGEDSRPLER